MYLWGFLYLLSAFAASGDCLQCLTCSGISLESCSTTNIVSCLDGHVCVLQKRTTNANGSIAGYFERFCAPPTECNVTGTFTHYLTKDRIATTCCYIDLCTPEIPIVPTGNSEPNGLSCPKCSLTGDFCTTDPNMNCTGNETMCLLVSTLTKRGAQTELQMTRGCASSGYCSKNNVTSAISDGYTEITYQCTKGRNPNDNSTTATVTTSATFHCSFSLSAIVFLFILLILMS